ncbi:hypothetical protein XENTR_v10017730 [Xenopus tropicalis]|nr:hypothetical protein XENTR_v10017730 [Xenopus tropicalis]
MRSTSSSLRGYPVSHLKINLATLDSAMLYGRRYSDGSGGNNHALQHYQETGFPLAVKLGTITPNGACQFCTKELLSLLLLCPVCSILLVGMYGWKCACCTATHHRGLRVVPYQCILGD